MFPGSSVESRARPGRKIRRWLATNTTQSMREKIAGRAAVTLVLLLMTAGWQRVLAANVMNNGADGNDYYGCPELGIKFNLAI